VAKKTPARVFGIKKALRGMTKISAEIRYKSCFEGPGFTTGVISFRPQVSSDPKQISHDDKDVVCHVLKGQGTLRLESRKIRLRPGMVCHIPKGKPHDFAAGRTGDLVLLYSLIRTG
jgi:quercetin dioxygenase-like cupin family protein